MSFPLREEEGWTGWFTRDHAEGALANGTRIVKSAYEDGDANPLGAKGVIVGSFRITNERPVLYFVEWEDYPRCAVGVMDWKIEESRNE